MQQIQPLGLRAGVTQGWVSNQYHLHNKSLDRRYKWLLRKIFAKHGLFLINGYYYNMYDQVICTGIYYKYIQRGRLPKYLAKLTRQGDILLAPPFIRLYTYRRFAKIFFRARKVLEPQFGPFAMRTVYRGWGDMELTLYGPLTHAMYSTLYYFLRKKFDFLFLRRTRISLYDVYQFLPPVNPVFIKQYYTFQKFSSLLYVLDIIQIIMLSTYLHTTRLLTHVLSIGLERHETKRKQKRFVALFRIALARAVTWRLFKRRPFDWRVSLFGKLDGQMRRHHTFIKIGKITPQRISFLINYSMMIAKTKFGTTSVRIWIRNLMHWKTFAQRNENKIIY